MCQIGAVVNSLIEYCCLSIYAGISRLSVHSFILFTRMWSREDILSQTCSQKLSASKNDFSVSDHFNGSVFIHAWEFPGVSQVMWN